MQSAPESERRSSSTPPCSPRFFLSSMTSAATSPGSHRRIAIAVDLSDESAYAVKWTVQNYIRQGDVVILLHVRPTSVLYGADWGSIDLSMSELDSPPAEPDSPKSQQKRREEEFDAFTVAKANDLAQPLVEADIPFKVHIVKDHDMKERLCLELERLGISAMIMGSRGFGAVRKNVSGRLGSVSDYCVHHCVCPVVVVRYPEDKDAAVGAQSVVSEGFDEEELPSVPEENENIEAADSKVFKADAKGSKHYNPPRGQAPWKGEVLRQIQIQNGSNCL